MNEPQTIDFTTRPTANRSLALASTAGGRHEVEPENPIPTNQAAVSPSERRRIVRQSGRFVLTHSKGDVIAQLRAMIRVQEGRAL